MSLKHIENRRDPTVFGADLDVLLGDITINGDLTVLGTINGNSAQGQNGNNTWTGTNEFSVYRPQTIPVTGVGFSGINLVKSQNQLATQGITNVGATWTGVNTFNNQWPVQSVGPLPSPVAGTDACMVINAQTAANTKKASFLTANQTWTGVNVFEVLPICIDPVLGPEISTKNYVDTTTAAVVVGKAQTVVSQVNLTDTFATSLAIQVQCIGGGGGSTFSQSNTAQGYAGGGGATGSILILNRAIGGVSQATWSIGVGTGGVAGVGTTPPASSSQNGTGTALFVQSPALGVPVPIVVFGANGGFGNAGFAGDTSTGPSLGGVYDNALNTIVTSPLSSANGNEGTLGGAGGTQSSGLQLFGTGGSAETIGNGFQGIRGGYGITKYIG